MQIQIDVLRREAPDQESFWQSIPFETEDETDTVAAALTKINADSGIKDTDGASVRPIRWECSCLQKKCGACAMVINSRPRLACDVSLKEFAAKGRVILEPLRKFPVVADLMVDRSILFENLKTLGIWFEEEINSKAQAGDTAYEASRCLQCGCCLEVCPNFCAGDRFAGMAALVPMARILTALPEAQKQAVRRAYRERLYEGCGKSLACRNICPAGIDIDGLLVNSNAAAVWKRRLMGAKPGPSGTGLEKNRGRKK